MSATPFTYPIESDPSSLVKEGDIEAEFISKLVRMKYSYREDIRDWCKNDFEVVSQLRINTRSSYQRYDVMLLINGIPCVQVELKTLDVSPHRAMQQIVDYKSEPDNGFTNTLLCFMQLFIVSNRTNTYYFASINDAIAFFDLFAQVQNNKIPVQKLSITDYISTENLLPDFSGITCASNLPNVKSVTEFLPDDILVANIRPYLKKAWSATRKGGASNDVIVFRSRDNVKQKFLSIRIRSDAFIDHVMSGAKGVKMPRGDVAQMKTFPFPLPESVEQQKIAGCLSALDEQIAAQTDQIAALKEHKQGLMQQLFPNSEGSAA